MKVFALWASAGHPLNGTKLQLTTRRSQRAHAAESLRRAGEIPALQHRSAFLPKRTRARGQASTPVPHLCKPLGLSLNLLFSPAKGCKRKGATAPAGESPLPSAAVLPCRGRFSREGRHVPVETALIIVSDKPSSL